MRRKMAKMIQDKLDCGCDVMVGIPQDELVQTHACPYNEDVNNADDDEYCDCCKTCTSGCADDI